VDISEEYLRFLCYPFRNKAWVDMYVSIKTSMVMQVKSKYYLLPCEMRMYQLSLTSLIKFIYPCSVWVNRKKSFIILKIFTNEESHIRRILCLYERLCLKLHEIRLTRQDLISLTSYFNLNWKSFHFMQPKWIKGRAYTCNVIRITTTATILFVQTIPKTSSHLGRF
jgi:hypothetical protein